MVRYDAGIMQPGSGEAPLVTPTTTRERIREIDVLRGFALVGIIVANMRGFNSPMEVYIRPYLVWDGTVDRIAQGFIDWFVGGKFITLFAILFGLGFAVQLERAKDRFTGVYVRRLAGLLVIGAAHAFLIWWGDILLTYAVMGFFLIVFRAQSQSSVFLWSMVLYWFPVMVMVGFFVVSLAGPVASPELPEASEEGIQRTIEIYTQGSYGEVLIQRYQDWQSFNSSFPVGLPRILAMFLFGVWVWRQGILQNVRDHLPLLRKTCWWSLPIGLAGNGYFVLVNELWRPNPMEPTALNLSWWIATSVGVPALSLFYACSVVLLYQREAWRRRLRPFAAVGRMALTNYLMQSVVCTFLYYGFGLALFGKVGPALGLAIAFVIYALQVVFSTWWARAFRFGPAEWVWRSLTYGKVQPLRAG